MHQALRLLLDRRRRRGSARAARFEPLEPRTLLTGDPLISEFMAINNSTLTDGDGETPDWIEIHNPGDVSVDMDGWFLTDKKENPTKWQLPDVELAAGDYLIVFASEKNNPPLGELHANFRLSGGGEYLALIKPDGVTITTEFDPYPQQVADVAYGLGADATAQTFLAADAPLRAHVPADGSLDLTWTEPAFDDAGWTAGTGGVGFDTAGDYDAWIGTDLDTLPTPMLGNNPGAYVRSDFTVADPAAVDSLTLDVQYDDGFVAYLNGQEVASRNATSTALSPETGLVSYYDFEGDTQDKASEYDNNSGTLENDLTPVGNAPGYVNDSDRQAIALNAAAGDTHHLEAPSSAEVDLGAVYTFEAWIKPTNLDTWSRMILNWAAPMAYHFALENGSQLSLIHTEQGAPEFLRAIGGTVALNQWQHVAGVADGTNLVVYLDGQEVGRTAYDGTINTTGGGLGIGDMAGLVSGADFLYQGYMDDLAVWNVALTDSQIRSHYLAGELGYGLTEAGASNELAWNSTAMLDRSDAEATAVETIDISAFADVLTVGDNVLAVHGLNSAVDDDDFLIRTELQAADLEIRPDVKRYFATPTPGGPNGTGANDLGPIVNSVEHDFVPPVPATEVPLVETGGLGQYLVPDETNGPALADTWIEPDYVPGTHGETWTTAPSGYGFDDADGNFAGEFATDVSTEMENTNATAYFRHEFDLPGGATPERLALDVKYDDGFVAYLNGREIASRNAAGIAPAPAPDSSVTYYAFDGNLLDSADAGTTADNLTATPALAETYAPGVVGDAVRIGNNGSGEAVLLTAVDSSDLDLASSWTIESFVKPDGDNYATWGRFITKWFGGAGTAQYHWGLQTTANGNGQDLFFNGVSTIGSSGSVPLDRWSHVAMTGDPANGIRLWHDGQVVGTAAYQAPLDSTHNFHVANADAGAAGNQFTGLVDELLIHGESKDETYMQARAALLPEVSAPPTAGLISYWGFENNLIDTAVLNEENSGVAIDTLSPGGGASSFVPGLVGRAAQIGTVGGEATWLAGAFSPDVALPATYTIEAWINPSDLSQSWERLVLNWGAEFGYHFALRSGGGLVDAVSLFHQEAGGGQPNANGGTVVAGQWQHVAGVADGSHLKVYLDGQLVAQTPYDGTIATVAAEGLGVGDQHSGATTIKYHGAIDELAIWNVPLSTEQIDAHYEAGAAGYGLTAKAIANPVGLVSYYDFNGDTEDSASDYPVSTSTAENDLFPVGGAAAYADVDGHQAIALNVVGGSHHLETPASPDVDLGALYTFEAWINPTVLSGTNSWNRMLLNWAAPMAYHFALRNSGQLSLIHMEDGETVWLEAAGGTVVTGHWQHVAGVADGTDLVVYLNGVEVGRTSYDGTINSTGGALGVGEFAGTSGTINYQGYMDDLAMWNVALSPDQIAAHHAAGPAGYGLDSTGGAGLDWQSAASAEHPDAEAVVAERIDVTAYRQFLQPTGNVLAIHALNVSADDGDFLMSAQLTGENGGGDSDSMRVSAHILRTLADVGTVTLHHRVMFDAEQSTVMLDDGSGYDEVAGDGVFTGLIPLYTAEPGEMVRYYVAADDIGAVTTRAPLFPDPVNSPEYFGTVIDDPAIVTDLPVLHRFVLNAGAAETGAGTRASVFYNGEFYDNVFLRIRGQTSRGYLKKSYKIDFNDGYHFRFHEDHARVEEINLNTTYTDKSYLRQVLAYETFRDAGSPYSESFPVRQEQNGQFWAISHIVEQVDRDYLRRNGLDEDGALYKAGANNLTGTATSGFAKKNRRDENYDDLQAFINGLALADDTVPLENFIFDNVNLPGQISYMVANIINQNIDRTVKNYYAYRDTDGTGEWQMLPWDVDLTFGPDALNTDVVKATYDGDPDHTSHPFLGGSEFTFRNLWNRLLDVVYKNDATREMFLRRLRTVMDEMLGPPPASPGDPPVNPYFENRVAELGAALGPDVLLDRAKWGGNAHFGATDPTLQEEIDEMIAAYFEPRRTHLYETHNIDNLPTAVTTVLDSSAAAKALVPVDGSLGLSWTERVFDDAAWAAGNTGVGYDEAATYLGLLGLDLRADGTPADNDTNNDLTSENDSVYIRIPFTVADPAALTQLKLRMKYDDGFVAYINGVRVAGANDPAGITWNSASTGQHDDGVALVFADFDISQFGGPGGILVPASVGTNVLAIHGLNDMTNGTGTSSDMLLLPEIVNGTPGYSGSVGIPNAQEGNPAIDIGEVMFNPGLNQDEEYIALTNAHATAVDISGWRLENAVDLTFAPGTVIPAGGTLYVSPNVAAFRARAQSPTGGEGLFVQGNYGGHLSNLGETIEIRATDGTLVTSEAYVGSPSDAQQYLRISEVMYHPAPTAPEPAADDGDDFEFIELVNTSDTVTLVMDGVSFTRGITFDFPDDLPEAETSLGPGERILVVRDEAAFTARYGTVGMTVAGEYGDPVTGDNKLSNNGEVIKLEDAENSTIAQFEYKDGPKWPQAADGGGSSLVPVTLDADLDQYESWHSSVEVGGSPGDAAAAAVLERRLFYAGSSFGTAVAADKTALLPGETATVDNITNYSGGIDGIIVDLAHAPGATGLDEGDLALTVGNDNDPTAWVAASGATLDVLPGGGRGGSDRLVITWAENAPKNTWLEVTVPGGGTHETTTTGLAADDVFYFGSAIGEVTALGAGLPTPPTAGLPGLALVSAADVIAIRDNPRGEANPASIDDPFDINRDRAVDALDLILARDNATGPLSALRLIEPALPAPAPPGEGEPALGTGSPTRTVVASLDGLMAAGADRTAADAPLPSATLGKLHRRFGANAR